MTQGGTLSSSDSADIGSTLDLGIHYKALLNTGTTAGRSVRFTSGTFDIAVIHQSLLDLIVPASHDHAARIAASGDVRVPDFRILQITCLGTSR